MKHLLYIADPMCSWCYGFSPELTALLAKYPETNVDLLMGGLRAYNTTVMDAALKDTLRGHWEHVRGASGQAFSPALFDRDDFVYNTEPACRAVIVARGHSAALALEMMHAIQNAFYRDGRDVTQLVVLKEIAKEIGMREDEFTTAFTSQEAQDAAREDFIKASQIGVEGFPTLALIENNRLYLVANGYIKADVLEERIGRVTALAAQQLAGNGVTSPGE